MKRCLLFDFDYTLADSSSAVVECVNDALRKMDIDVVSADRIHKTIGLSLDETYHELSGDTTADKVETFQQLFIARADAIMVDKTRIFPCAPTVIRCLRATDFLLGIVSTKFRHRIQAILEKEQMQSLFDLIIGREDVSRPKPDPMGLLQAMSALEVPARDCLFIGDSLTDARTAKRAGVDFVAVLSGVTHEEDFRQLGANNIIKDLRELPGLLRQHYQGTPRLDGEAW